MAVPDKHCYWYCYPVDDTVYSIGSNPIEAIVIDLSKNIIKLRISKIFRSVYLRKGLYKSGYLKESFKRVIS